MLRQNRRTFLKHAASTGVATTFTITGTRASGRVLGATSLRCNRSLDCRDRQLIYLSDRNLAG